MCWVLIRMKGMLTRRKDATEAGEKFYYTGKECKYGHLDKRYTTNGLCVTCAAKRSAEWAANHPDKFASLQKEWKDKNCEYMKAYRETHKTTKNS